MRYLIYLILGWIVWSWIKRKLLPSPSATDQTQIATEMVACAVCSLHLPRAEAVVAKGVVYCSQEHQQQAAQLK